MTNEERDIIANFIARVGGGNAPAAQWGGGLGAGHDRPSAAAGRS